MSRTSRSWTFQQGLPEWAALALLLSTLVLEAWDLWGDWRTRQAEPVTAEDCFAFCHWWGAQPKTWASYSCECFEAQEEP